MCRCTAAIAWGLAFGLALAACSGRSVPHPRFVPHPTSALVEVPYPPPPARVEQVPSPPHGDAVWIDGEWLWQGRRWAWRKGRWVLPPSNASQPAQGVAFSPWTLVRRDDGVLFAAAGAWRNDKGEAIADPPVLLEAEVGRGSVVSSEGESERAGLARARDGGSPRRRGDIRAESNDAGTPGDTP